MKFDEVKRDDWLLAGVAFLLAIDLLFLPWFDISVGAGALSISVTSTATGAPDGWLGILALLPALAVIVDLAVEHMSPQTSLPAIGGSRTATRLALSATAALFVALKFLFHIHFGLFGIGFWAAVVLTAALVMAAAAANRGRSLLPTPHTAPPSA